MSGIDNRKLLRLLVSGKSEGRKPFFLSLLEQHLAMGKAVIVVDIEDSVAGEVERLCLKMHYPLRIQGSVVDLASWDPAESARFVCHALSYEQGVEQALLYRFMAYLAELYRAAGQTMTMGELAECDMKNAQEAAYHLQRDDIYEFLQEFSRPLMAVESAVRRYGSMMRCGNTSPPKPGECLLLRPLGRRGDGRLRLQLHALRTLLKAPGCITACCFQWGTDKDSEGELLSILASCTADYLLFARDAMNDLVSDGDECFDEFDQIVLLRHSNPESCRRWAEFIGMRQIWNPAVSRGPNSGFRLFKIPPLPLPGRQDTHVGLDRRECSVTLNRQERFRIPPARLTMLGSGRCIMIDRNRQTVEELGLC